MGRWVSRVFMIRSIVAHAVNTIEGVLPQKSNFPVCRHRWTGQSAAGQVNLVRGFELRIKNLAGSPHEAGATRCRSDSERSSILFSFLQLTVLVVPLPCAAELVHAVFPFQYYAPASAAIKGPCLSLQATCMPCGPHPEYSTVAPSGHSIFFVVSAS